MKTDEELIVVINKYKETYNQALAKFDEAEKVFIDFKKTATAEEIRRLGELALDMLKQVVAANPDSPLKEVTNLLDEMYKKAPPKTEDMN
jgi:outer membrane lipopolysaccharide assembly protein LptE/RlpB